MTKQAPLGSYQSTRTLPDLNSSYPPQLLEEPDAGEEEWVVGTPGPVYDEHGHIRRPGNSFPIPTQMREQRAAQVRDMKEDRGAWASFPGTSGWNVRIEEMGEDKAVVQKEISWLN